MPRSSSPWSKRSGTTSRGARRQTVGLPHPAAETYGPACWHGLETVPQLVLESLPSHHSPNDYFPPSPFAGSTMSLRVLSTISRTALMSSGLAPFFSRASLRSAAAASNWASVMPMSL